MPLRGTAGIVFDSGEIVTPVITEDARLSSAELQGKFFLSGNFKDPDNVFIKIHIESGHASTSHYNITGQRLKSLKDKRENRTRVFATALALTLALF